MGAGVDTLFGGATVGVGIAVGAVVGGAGAYLGGDQAARILSTKDKRLKPSIAKSLRNSLAETCGDFFSIGPVTSQKFAWMLIDRSLSHARAIVNRAHACQSDIEIPIPTKQESGIVAKLPKEMRDSINKALTNILKGAQKGKVPSDPEVNGFANLLVQAIDESRAE